MKAALYSGFVAGLRSGTWALMFTDLVGSTAQRARIGDEAADALRREHDSIVRRVTVAHDGVVVKGTGDGALVAFAGASDAVAAAVRMQQAIERRNRDAMEPIGVRIGISLGDVSAEGDDLFGLAVNEAARVCSLADAAEVVLSDVVRVVAGSRLSHDLLDRGEFELSGLPSPTRVWQVGWEPTAEQEMPFPSLLRARSTFPFGGRQSAVAVMEAAWSEAIGHSARTILVAGEPGIGKTRLVGEVGRGAHDDGALVLYGRCDAELGVPFQPFTEALGWYYEHIDDACFGSRPQDLARLDPRVTPSGLEHTLSDPETEQLRLFEAVTAWLSELSVRHPLVVVLDDLHWATRPTLQMLRHLLTHLGESRTLVLGTYRDTDLDRQHPLAQLLPDLRRLPGVDRLALRGLDEPGVTELLELGEDRESRDAEMRRLVPTLVDETEGNPLFIGEVLRHLTESGLITHGAEGWRAETSIDKLGLPEGVKAVIGQRLDRLGPEANAVLRTGAVIGRDFDTELLVVASGAGEDAVVDVVDRALDARLVEETGRDRYRFTHALVRNTLVDELSSARRTRTHRAIAEALELLRGPSAAAALARHWSESSGASAPGHAAAWALVAADSAMQRAAFDEAVQLLVHAWDVAGGADVGEETKAKLLIALGDAQMASGRIDAGRDAYAAAATQLPDDSPLLTDIAIAFKGPARVESDDERIIPLLRRALASVNEATDPTVAARLHAQLSLTLPDEDPESGHEADAALVLAERSGDPEARFDAQRARFWKFGPDEKPWERTKTILRLARELGRPNDVLEALVLSLLAAGQRGDYVRFAALTQEYHDVAEESRNLLGQGFSRLVQARVAMTAGDLDAAEQLVAEAIQINPDEAVLLGWAQIHIQVLTLRDQHDDAIENLRSWLDADTLPGATRLIGEAGLGRLLAWSGDAVAARMTLEAIAADDFGRFTTPTSALFPVQLALVTDLVAALDDDVHAEKLAAWVRPWVGQNFQASLPEDFGPAALYLGKLEYTCGRLDAAAVYLRQAIESSHAGGAHLKAAEARIELGRALRADDPAAARASLEQARTFAAERGIALFVHRADNLLAGL
jgi:class 3 adenylate cyclase/tetratricopeptide (TPR) repeat protein